jgi:aerobic carbon-monoxide dehydrogenase medium subunit
MKSASFDYHRPQNINDALTLLQMPDYRIIAGGQSLVPMMNFRLVAVRGLVDLNDISELSAIQIDKNIITFGAMVRQRQIERHEDVIKNAPIFGEAIREIGHRQTRNRGTIGGSLCQLDPSAELPLLCLLHDGIITVQSLKRTHNIKVADFIRGAMDPQLDEGDIVTHIRIKTWPRYHGYAFMEYARRAGDFAIGSAGCLLTLTPHQTIDEIAVCIGGLSDVPQRLHHSETLIKGQKINETIIDNIARSIDDLGGHPTVQASVAFKKQITKTLLKRVIIRAYDRALDQEMHHEKNN